MKKLFTENLSLKLTALFIAGLLEFYFYSPDNSLRTTVEAAISFENLPNRTMIVEPSGRLGVQLSLEGPEPLIEKVKANPPVVNLSLPPEIGSSWTFRFKEDLLNLPIGVKLTDWKPQKIDFTFDKKIKRSVPVRLKGSEGGVLSQKQLEGVLIKPERILVSGPEGEVSEIEEVFTEAFDIESSGPVFARDISIEDVGKLSTLSVNMVNVSRAGVSSARKKAIEGVPISLLTATGYSGSLSQNTASIVLSGPGGEIDKLKSSDLTLIVDATRSPIGSHNLKVSALLPEGYKMVATSPPEVKATIFEPAN